MQNYALVENGKPFTQNGAEELLKTNSKLSEYELQLETAALRADFREYVATRFAMKDSQRNFLNNLDDQTVAHAATVCSIAMANRLPIFIEKPVSKRHDEIPPFKTLSIVSNLRTESANDGSSAASGYVTVVISYAE
ncbi:MAG: hypothetical protein V4687_09760 [Bacteroidota bacterium]